MAFWFEAMPVLGEDTFDPMVKHVYNLDNVISYNGFFLPQHFKMIDEKGNLIELDDKDIEAENSRTKFDLLHIRFVGDAEHRKLVVTNQTMGHIRGASWTRAQWRAKNHEPYPYDEDE